MFALAVAFAWGFAEATLFFIVPDVWLSYLALTDLRRSLRGCVATLAGALAGGAALYAWCALASAAATSVVSAVPAIGPEIMAKSASLMREQGVWSLVEGMMLGIPYKTFVVSAQAQGVGLALLLAVTIPARLLRFAVASAVTHAIATRVLRSCTARTKLAVLVMFWVVFYAIYFTLHYQK